ncbi:hypothetical protein BDN70DRAFT_894504 [Pholiota conissans]|uniref:Uncharacterized protein n=1 Tax=Pholiota conissans TaxID=109636 RepID=A0A9P6D145_9AGAR|nr:hypothetical protein BDN70DRAFT_894504 [Pholiota conissans]
MDTRNVGNRRSFDGSRKQKRERERRQTEERRQKRNRKWELSTYRLDGGGYIPQRLPSREMCVDCVGKFMSSAKPLRRLSSAWVHNFLAEEADKRPTSPQSDFIAVELTDAHTHDIDSGRGQVYIARFYSQRSSWVRHHETRDRLFVGIAFWFSGCDVVQVIIVAAARDMINRKKIVVASEIRIEVSSNWPTTRRLVQFNEAARSWAQGHWAPDAPSVIVIVIPIPSSSSGERRPLAVTLGAI